MFQKAFVKRKPHLQAVPEHKAQGRKADKKNNTLNQEQKYGAWS